jgi:hypothetical protein
MVELMIAASISSLVMGAVVALLYISGRCIVETYGQTRTRSSRMRAIDQVYFRLCDGQVGSIAVSQDGRRIDFRDPNKGVNRSSFFFNPANKVLYYDANTSDGIGAIPVAVGPLDITFERQSAGALTLLKVKSSSQMAYGDVDSQVGQTAVYLRNPMVP